MSGQFPPLTCKDVKLILKTLGFTPRPQNGTSHEQWVKTDNKSFYKVTVDCPKAPFSKDLILSMCKQAGVSKQQFYAVLKK
ncbi:MAG: type II toxin-antitoxin system HicA family toxin [Sulfuriferula sp.]